MIVALKDTRADPTLLAGDDVSLIEHHCLPNTAQPAQDETTRGLTSAETRERNLEVRISVSRPINWGGRAPAPAYNDSDEDPRANPI